MNPGLHRINLRGELVELKQPIIMGIINTTPDSFYSKSRSVEIKDIHFRLTEMKNEGVDWLDIGGYSSRPGAEDISAQVEIERLKPALEIISSDFAEIPVSIDTFRSEVAEWAITNFNIDFINDISGGHLDNRILDVVSQANKIYIGMHMRGTPQIMQTFTNYDNLVSEIKRYFAEMENRVAQKGISDLIIDPGFGFSKTMEQNYMLLHRLHELSIFNRPLLVGLSRKSMIYKYLNIKPEEALNGTIALQTTALWQGAVILRVHDVKEAVQTKILVSKIKEAV
jgi:dihydropteroate synthase